MWTIMIKLEIQADKRSVLAIYKSCAIFPGYEASLDVGLCKES